MSDSIEKIADEISHSLDVRAPKWAARLRAISSLRQVPEGWVLVRKEAIDWLNGESNFECPPDRYFRGKPPKYWWRSVFREKAGLDNPAPPTSGEYPAKFERHGSETTDAADLLTVSGYSEKYSAVFLDCDKFPPLSTVRVYAADATPAQAEAYPEGSDREVLNYLMQQFDAESWECRHCGHSEDCATMDSAIYLREYLAKHPAQAGAGDLKIRLPLRRSDFGSSGVNGDAAYDEALTSIGAQAGAELPDADDAARFRFWLAAIFSGNHDRMFDELERSETPEQYVNAIDAARRGDA